MKDSFENIQTWKTDVDRHVRTHKFLVGNKTDLPDRCITPEAAEVVINTGNPPKLDMGTVKKSSEWAKNHILYILYSNKINCQIFKNGIRCSL